VWWGSDKRSLIERNTPKLQQFLNQQNENCEIKFKDGEKKEVNFTFFSVLMGWL
jgi:hypothetical protein